MGRRCECGRHKLKIVSGAAPTRRSVLDALTGMRKNGNVIPDRWRLVIGIRDRHLLDQCRSRVREWPNPRKGIRHSGARFLKGTAHPNQLNDSSGSQFNLVLHPNGMLSTLEFTGTVNISRIDGPIHHYTTDDCNFRASKRSKDVWVMLQSRFEP